MFVILLLLSPSSEQLPTDCGYGLKAFPHEIDMQDGHWALGTGDWMQFPHF